MAGPNFLSQKRASQRDLFSSLAKTNLRVFAPSLLARLPNLRRTGQYPRPRSYFCEEWGNPSSAYKFGLKLKGLIETARAQIAEFIGAQPREEAPIPESG